MGAVLGEAVSVVSAQGTRQGVCRIGGAQQVTVTLYRIFAFQNGNHDRAGGHELNQTYLCSRGFANSPSRCDLKYFGDTNLVFSTVAALAARVHPGHIVIYAPGD